MRVVVLGAAGQLGREVVSTLSTGSHAVFAAVRRPPVPAFADSVEIRLANARNKCGRNREGEHFGLDNRAPNRAYESPAHGIRCIVGTATQSVCDLAG